MESTAIRLLDEPTLVERLRAYMQKASKTTEEVATAMGYARPTLSLYLNEKYSGNTDKLEAKIRVYLSQVEDGISDDTGETTPARRVFQLVGRFFETQDARSVIGVCKSSQDYSGFGIVVGRSGFGKTHTLRHYAKLPRVAYLECDDTMSSRDLVEEIERLLGLSSGGGTIRKRVGGIRDFFRQNPGYLLIVDEADKLISKNTQKKMEILRGIYDQSTVGIVVAGEPKLESQIKSLLPRLANRIDFYTRLGGLHPNEVTNYLTGLGADPVALEELISRGCNPQNGCFRLLNRTMKNVLRLLEQRSQDTVTLKVIQSASGMMLL